MKNFLLVIFLGHAAIASETFEDLREESRQIMRVRACSVCHVPPGNEKALKIYNLDNKDWTATMSDDQLGQIPWRIKGDPANHKFKKNEIETLTRFVEAEQKRRKALQPWFGN